jgi:predicted unusual protein kinase regulating ubiquinone biosynthesis (AarF/ABC1/UbiB family)
VELVYTFLEKYSLNEIKREVLKILQQEKDFWNAGKNLNEIRKHIHEAKTIEDTIAYLTTLFYKKFN